MDQSNQTPQIDQVNQAKVAAELAELTAWISRNDRKTFRDASGLVIEHVTVSTPKGASK